MGKYDALADYLHRMRGSRVQLSFDEIAALMPGGLPASARNHAAWWANESEGSHVQARAWVGNGWQVDRVDLARGRVTFVTASK